jgi:hypothetical protein
LVVDVPTTDPSSQQGSVFLDDVKCAEPRDFAEESTSG